MADQIPPNVLDDISEQMMTDYMGFVSFTILIWDHVDTFAAEVEYIWKGRKGPLVYLFLINRYLTPLGFMVNLFAYLSPVWKTDTCSHFIRYEGAMTVIGINIVAMMMLLRVYALYHRQYFIIGIVMFLWLFQLSMNAYLLTRGEAVVHNKASGVHACTMIFDPAISKLASSSAWLPLLYDTVVLGLTVNRTFPSLKKKNTSYVMKRLLEDGLIYYTVIFAVTLVLTIMIVAAPPGIKNITAQLELLLTVTMMSRITLNLKKSVHKVQNTHVKPELPSLFTQQSQFRPNPNVRIVTPGFDSKRRPGPTVTFGADSIQDMGATFGSVDGDGDSAAFPLVRVPNFQRQDTQLSAITQESSGYDFAIGRSMGWVEAAPPEEDSERTTIV